MPTGVFRMAAGSEATTGSFPPDTTVVRYRPSFTSSVWTPAGICKGSSGRQPWIQRVLQEVKPDPRKCLLPVASNTMQGSKHIGTTHQIDGDGNVIATKTASADGIKFSGG